MGGVVVCLLTALAVTMKSTNGRSLWIDITAVADPLLGDALLVVYVLSMRTLTVNIG